jgi:predicted LPLAT superfamily acyltransferase
MGSAPASADWARRPERGSLTLLRFMASLSLAIGRTASRVPLRAIAAYFFLSSPAARAASRAYLRRCLGREPRLSERFAHFMAFATTIHDRLYFLQERDDLFEVEVVGPEALPPSGALLFGAHLGSFEALRAAGLRHGHRRVTMAMYEENARQLNAILAAVSPGMQRDIVPLGHVGSMIALNERLEAGDLVGVLADRTLGEEPVLRVPFLGEPASFPTGPMRMAAALRRPVFLMAGLYLGGNRYRVVFEPLVDFSQWGPGLRRGDEVEAGVRAYAARLEHYCRESPFNWFNFFDFWRDPR